MKTPDVSEHLYNAAVSILLINGGDGGKSIIDKIMNSNAQNLPELRAFEAFEIDSKSTKFEVNSFSMDEIRVQYKDEEFGSVDLTEEDTIFTSHMRNTGRHGS